MPDDQLIGARRHIGHGEPALFVRLGKVGIRDGHPPTLHVGMETALHDKDPTIFAEFHQLFHRRTGHVFVVHAGLGAILEIAWMLRIHRERHVEQDTRA